MRSLYESLLDSDSAVLSKYGKYKDGMIIKYVKDPAYGFTLKNDRKKLKIFRYTIDFSDKEDWGRVFMKDVDGKSVGAISDNVKTVDDEIIMVDCNIDDLDLKSFLDVFPKVDHVEFRNCKIGNLSELMEEYSFIKIDSATKKKSLGNIQLRDKLNNIISVGDTVIYVDGKVVTTDIVTRCSTSRLFLKNSKAVASQMTIKIDKGIEKYIDQKRKEGFSVGDLALAATYNDLTPVEIVKVTNKICTVKLPDTMSHLSKYGQLKTEYKKDQLLPIPPDFDFTGFTKHYDPYLYHRN